jgi:aminomethyltransferase
MIRHTPFHARTSPATRPGVEPLGRYLAANRYQVGKFEYFAIRNAAGMFDTSPLFKYRIAGRDAEKYLAAY